MKSYKITLCFTVICLIVSSSARDLSSSHNALPKPSELENEVDMSSRSIKLRLGRIEQAVNELQSGQAEVQRILLKLQPFKKDNTQEARQQYENILTKLSIIEKHINTQSNFVSSDNECGGILIGEQGNISFELTTPEKFENYFICIWTIRIPSKHWVKFELDYNNLTSDASIVLTPFRPMLIISNDTSPVDEATVFLTNETEINSKFTAPGPIVFVTFIVNRSSSAPARNGFQLSFSATETGQPISENFDDYKFSHFHFRDSSGSISYPQMKGDNKYSPKEVVTFTVSTSINHTVYLNTLELEDNSLCRYDSFSRFVYYPEFGFSTRFGEPSTDYRYCGELTDVTDLNSSQGTIILFKSDEHTENTGFSFSWNSTGVQ